MPKKSRLRSAVTGLFVKAGLLDKDSTVAEAVESPRDRVLAAANVLERARVEVQPKAANLAAQLRSIAREL